MYFRVQINYEKIFPPFTLIQFMIKHVSNVSFLKNSLLIEIYSILLSTQSHRKYIKMDLCLLVIYLKSLKNDVQEADYSGELDTWQ